MNFCRAIALFALVVAGCGDNQRPASTSYNAPGGVSSVGGSQVARSKSFTLVTSVSSSPQATSKNHSVTLTSGMGDK